MSDVKLPITQRFDPIAKWTLPYLKEWRSQLPANLEQLCRELVPIYSFDIQSRGVKIHQHSQEWHLLRSNRITCSNFGTAVGRGYKGKTPDVFLKHWMWPNTEVISDFSRTAMSWGTNNEAQVREYYMSYVRQMTYTLRKQWFGLTQNNATQLTDAVKNRIRAFVPMTTLERLLNHVYVHMKTYEHNDIEIFEVGFCISEYHPWCGGSPDGLICRYDALLGRFVIVGLLEIKCPFRGVFYPEIPTYYFDQVQGFMNLFDIPWCHFVTWVPGQMKIENVPCDTVYWSGELFPKLQEFYFRRYLPRKVLQQFGLLQTNTIAPIVPS